MSFKGKPQDFAGAASTAAAAAAAATAAACHTAALWEASRTAAQVALRDYKKSLRSEAHKAAVARGSASVRTPGPVLVGQACEGCNGLNHHALGCQRRPKCSSSSSSSSKL